MKNSSTLQQGIGDSIVRGATLTAFVLSLTSMTLGFDSASSIDTEASQRITSVLSKFHVRAGFPGATVGYSLADGSSGSVSVGFADEHAKIPMRGDHLMMAGSTGKTFFAALALKLVEQGTLHLDQKIATWFANESWFDRIPCCVSRHSGLFCTN